MKTFGLVVGVATALIVRKDDITDQDLKPDEVHFYDVFLKFVFNLII